jgi:tetratricopeptide (TPR) repeat protein
MPSVYGNPKWRAPLSVAVANFALAQGDLRIVEERLADVADLDARLADAPNVEAGLLYARASLAQRRGDWAAARASLESLEAVGYAGVHRGFEAMCVNLLAETCLGAGDTEGAFRHASRALALADQAGYAPASGMALYTLGTLAYRAGDLDRARHHFEASINKGQQPGHGPSWWVTYALVGLSHAAIDQGEYASGRAALVESLGRWPELGNVAVLARLLKASAHLAAATGRHIEALRLAAAAEPLRESAGRPRSSSERAAVERWLSTAYADVGEEIAAGASREGHAVMPEEALRVASASLADDKPPTNLTRRPRRTT